MSGTYDHAFLWKNDGKGMRDLNDLIDPADPLKPYVVLTKAVDINDAGDIVAEGFDVHPPGAQYRVYFLRGSSLVLSPRSLAFGNQKVGTSRTAKAVTVQNNGTSVVPITSIALKGAAAGQFASTNNCGSSLVGHAICTIKVIFKPTVAGRQVCHPERQRRGRGPALGHTHGYGHVIGHYNWRGGSYVYCNRMNWILRCKSSHGAVRGTGRRGWPLRRRPNCRVSPSPRPHPRSLSARSKPSRRRGLSAMGPSRRWGRPSPTLRRGTTTCALLTSGGVECWGYERNGELGDGNTSILSLPRPVKGIKYREAVGVGTGHGCAVLASGAVQCWG